MTAFACVHENAFCPFVMPPAARLTDMHTCPQSTGPVPHVGGPVVGPGCPTVIIGGLPAARVGDALVCVGPPDTIRRSRRSGLRRVPVQRSGSRDG